jgi:hypothetical protein
LDYGSVDVKDGKATVQLRESHEVIFDAIAPQVSKLANLQHVFTLHSKKGNWVIYKDEYHDELSEQLDQMSKQNIKKQVDDNYQQYQSPNRDNTGKSKNNLSPTLPRSPLAFTSAFYNRSLAVSYADTWAQSTNSNYSPRQSNGDCTNFVSQAIYAGMGYNPPYTQGGMSVSSGGWYYDFVTDTGSSPWVGVPQQYTFITGNSSYKGPYGYDANGALCPLNNGDIVQIKYNSTSYTHEGIIVSSPFPVCQNLQLSMYQIDAHDNDRYHYPLSNWASYTMRFIKINGYYK